MAKSTSGAADGTSQAQSTSGEPQQRETTPEEAVQSASGGSGENAEIQFFDATVLKVDQEGNEVMSDYLAPGEKLQRATTEEYAQEKTSERAEANQKK